MAAESHLLTLFLSTFNETIWYNVMDSWYGQNLLSEMNNDVYKSGLKRGMCLKIQLFMSCSDNCHTGLKFKKQMLSEILLMVLSLIMQ